VGGLSRREFLQRAAVLSAAGWVLPGVTMREALARTIGTAASPAGTTLEATIVRLGSGPYRRLGLGPAAPIVVRTLGAEAKGGREDRRKALASIVHLTDIHVIDAQSPTRVEFLDRYAHPSIPFSSAFRPQETLTAHVADAMVRRVNSLKLGPVTARRFDCVVSTGDNVDNQQENEVDWLLALLDGGPLAANSGDPIRYEGVQDDVAPYRDPHYWHPEEGPDRYKDAGFPTRPGLLGAAIRPFEAMGLETPWFTVYGNHDGLLSGNAPENPALEAVSTGPFKVIGLPAGVTPTGLDPSLLTLPGAPARPITPDAKRRFLSSDEWIARHLSSPSRPGPVGHGLSEENRSNGTLYYTFEISPKVLGISLDTVNRGGYAEGSIGSLQLAWLEQRLAEAEAAGRFVVLFSHHNIPTLTNRTPDASDPDRKTAAEIEAVLHRHPNVVAWVNGHSHENRIYPRPAPGGQRGFWEILTAAHVDYPQQARIVELVDNKDGTLSIFATIVEHAAPPAASGDGVLALASLSRELSANDPQLDVDKARGTPEDFNVELVLANPLRRR
jgi:metallophosphoesterase (TIGR03767 family)